MLLRFSTIAISFSLAGSLVLVGLASPVQAQGPGQNVAVTYPVNETEVEDGDIVARSRRSGTLRFSRVPGSPELFGVVVTQPMVMFDTGNEDEFPILRSGQALVKVTLAEGPIEVGDPITSSFVPGYGRKVGEDDTYQLGIAQEPFDGSNSTTTVQAGEQGEKEVATGRVLVDIDIGPTSREKEDDKPDDLSALGFFEGVSPLMIIKLLVAGVVAIGAIYSSFRYFGSNLSAGVSSVGRNPLAKKTIRRMVLMNIAAIVFVSLAGIGLSVVILFVPV